jgi:2-oxoglutarate ferredoxin oxidoreductase subunit alpha
MQKIVKTSFIYLFTIVVTFLFGIVVSDTINFYNSNYEIVFSVNEEFDYEKLDDQDYLISIKNTHEKYKEIEKNECLYEEYMTEDADVVLVAFGITARVSKNAVAMARKQGLKVGLIRPITLWPFPTKAIAEAAKGKKGVLVAEINAGQMIDDVKLAVNCSLPVEHFGRLGGIVPSPEEVVAAIKEKLM